MTKDEFEAQKAKIIKDLGEPIRDFDTGPNESARLIDELAKQRRQTGLNQKKESLNDFVAKIPKEEIKKAQLRPLEPVFIADHDLKAFNEQEKAIIRLYYEDSTLTERELARRIDVKLSIVVDLLQSAAFEALDVKYFKFNANRKTRRSIQYLLDDHNAKMTERMGEDLGIIKPEKQDININSKPIEDAEAMKMLRELGDKLSDKGE